MPGAPRWDLSGSAKSENKSHRGPPKLRATKCAASEEPKSQAERAAATHRAVANSRWPDAQAAAHQKVQIGESGSTILKIAEQLGKDREHLNYFISNLRLRITR